MGYLAAGNQESPHSGTGSTLSVGLCRRGPDERVRGSLSRKLKLKGAARAQRHRKAPSHTEVTDLEPEALNPKPLKSP